MLLAQLVFLSSLLLTSASSSESLQGKKPRISPRSASFDSPRSYYRPGSEEAASSESQAQSAVLSPQELAKMLVAETSHDAAVAHQIELGLGSADINQFRDEEGNTLLMLAIQRKFFLTTMELLGAGADPRLTNADGKNAIHLAAMQTDPVFLQAVLSCVEGDDGAMVARDNFGNTPLIDAAAHGDATNLFLLADHSRSIVQTINNRGVNGSTALIMATKNGNHTMMSLLMLYGGDPTERDDFGNSAISYAFDFPDTECIRILKTMGNKRAVRHEARAKSALSRAILNNSATWLMYLLRKIKVDVNREEFVPEMGVSMFPLFLAVSVNNESVVNYLLINGANPNLVDRNGDTVLLLAIRNSNTSLTKLLLQYGADPEISNSLTGETALSLAQGKDGSELEKSLKFHANKMGTAHKHQPKKTKSQHKAKSHHKAKTHRKATSSSSSSKLF